MGGVSERAGAEAGGSHPFALNSFACRGGERHPGLLEGGVLRGASSESRPRSVRAWAMVSSIACNRAGDSGCPEVAEEGNVVGRRAAMRRRPSQALVAGARERVLRSVLRPVLVDPHSTPREPSPVVRRSSWHHGWASLRKREEPTLGPSRADVARLAACHRVSQGTPAWHVRKGWRSRPPSLRGSNEPGFGCPHVDRSCRSQ